MPETVVVIGNPASVFVQAPVRYWRNLGVDAVIVTGRWPSASVADGLPVISAEALAPAAARRAADATVPLLTGVDATVARHEAGRVRDALRTWGHGAVQPSLAPPMRDALLIAAAVETLQPAAVLGHEAFAYGLATQLAPAPRRALFVWGADVLHYAWTSDVAFAMVREALLNADYVMTCAEPLRSFLHDRFGLPLERIALVHYGVDRRQFRRRTGEEDARIRASHGIPPGRRVVMNLRRYLPHWGAVLAGDVLLAVLAARPDTHAVLLEGADRSPWLEAALARAAARGLTDRLTAIRGHASMETVADLMGISDVAVSLVDSLEPLSWSVLQAVASGSAVVVTDQSTYRNESARGLSLTLVPPGEADATVAAVLTQLDAAGRTSGAPGAGFVARHYDQDEALRRQLRIVAGAAAAERMLRPPTAAA